MAKPRPAGQNNALDVSFADWVRGDPIQPELVIVESLLEVNQGLRWRVGSSKT
jgi:hypothetical protein